MNHLLYYLHDIVTPAQLSATTIFTTHSPTTFHPPPTTYRQNNSYFRHVDASTVIQTVFLL